VFESWQGVGDAWMFISKKAKKTPILIIKKIKAYMLQIIKKEQFKRLHAIVINDFPEGERLMKVLGFTCETPNGMKNYGPNGETCKLFSIVMEG
jgi:hypothetical protein